MIKAIITGTTGMVGKGVLLECLENDNVESVLVVNRRPLGMQHPKLKEVIHKDFFNIDPIKEELKGYNACYFCMGVSSVGLSNEEYYKLTYTLTTHWADTLVELSPDMTFCYVSGDGTSTEENARMEWANVKGKTENHILSLPFKDKYMFRPGMIQPLKGVMPSSKLYRRLIFIFKPLFSVVKAVAKNSITTSVNIGLAMIYVTLKGSDKKHLHNKDINSLAHNY